MSNVRPINDPNFPIRFNKTENTDKSTPIDKIYNYMKKNNFLAFKAITGSGKTISLPVKFANQGKTVLMTQPRVLNVLENVPIIDKVLHENFQNQNRTVGYITGQGAFTSDTDIITLCTEGSLLAIINNKGFNKALDGINILILDEVHERTTDLDLIMFYIKENNWLKKNKLIVTSATFNPSKFADYFGYLDNIAFLEGAKPNYKIEYPQTEQINDWCNFISNKIIEIHTNTELKKWRDILVFISSKFDIDKIMVYLNPQIIDNEKLNGLLITSLYRGMSSDEKNNSTSTLEELISNNVKTVAEKSPVRRVILATNIAETGITLPEVKYVIDMGIAKIDYFNPYTNSFNLVPSYISKNVAEQRWGRVGRSKDPDAEGIIYPLYTKETNDEMIEEPIPSILKNNIEGIILKFMNNNNDLNNINFLDNPTSSNINRAIINLKKLNLIDDNGQINEIGQYIYNLTVSPIHGKMILYGCKNGCLDAIITMVCIIEKGLNTLIHSADFKLPILYNTYMSDHVNLWLIYNHYLEHPNNPMFKQKGFIDLNDRITQIKTAVVNAGLPLNNNYEHTLNDTCMAIKKSVLDVIGEQIAHQDKDNNIIYSNGTVKGKLSSSYLFNNRRPMTSIYPKIVCYEQIQLKKKSGLEYDFSLITVPY